MTLKTIGTIIVCVVMLQFVKAATDTDKQPKLPKKMTDADVLAVTAAWAMMLIGIIMMTI